MCSTCLTGTEALLINTAGLAALATNVRDRLRHRTAGPQALAIANWEANASFLRTLDLDPVACLGPHPTWADQGVEPITTAPPTATR